MQTRIVFSYTLKFRMVSSVAVGHKRTFLKLNLMCLFLVIMALHGTIATPAPPFVSKI